MKKFALIVAGGSGSRMKSDIPKQFIILNGKPVLMHTVETFLKAGEHFHFVMVLPQSLIPEWEAMCKRHSFGQHTLVEGGITRFESVKNGLAQIKEEGIVFIHDGVRPLVSAQTIQNCYETAMEKGNALPVIVPSESVRKAEEGKNYAVNRSHYFLVQTPQTFKVSLIKKAYEQPYDIKFTDDASVLESYGFEIHLVEGNRENIKITYPEDIILADAYLQKMR